VNIAVCCKNTTCVDDIYGKAGKFFLFSFLCHFSALSGNNLGQVVDTHVPLFTKQYNLVRGR